MPKMGPIAWHTLVKIFELDGYKVDRQRGSHIILVKEGVLRPLVIPKHNKDLTIGVVQNNLRTAEMSRKRYFELSKKVK